jgi:hypothetical protein
MKHDSYVKENGNTGAFACTGNIFTQSGLSKRELLAAMAMQGFLSSLTSSLHIGHLVQGSVQVADALLVELEKTNKHEDEDD